MNEAVLDYDDLIEDDEKSLRELLDVHDQYDILRDDSALESVESITATAE